MGKTILVTVLAVMLCLAGVTSSFALDVKPGGNAGVAKYKSGNALEVTGRPTTKYGGEFSDSSGSLTQEYQSPLTWADCYGVLESNDPDFTKEAFGWAVDSKHWDGTSDLQDPKWRAWTNWFCEHWRRFQRRPASGGLGRATWNATRECSSANHRAQGEAEFSTQAQSRRSINHLPKPTSLQTGKEFRIPTKLFSCVRNRWFCSMCRQRVMGFL